jgi:hypothetical protein
MKNLLSIIFIFSACLILSSCIEKKVRDLDSPCVANEFNPNSQTDYNNPCIRRPVNKVIA